MGYISSQIKAGVNGQLKQLNANEIATKVRTAIDERGIDPSKLQGIRELGAPVEAMKSQIKLGDTALNQLNPPAGITNYIPKPVTDILGDVKLPTEIGGVPIPQLPDLSAATSSMENLVASFGIDTSIFKDLGIRDIASILQEPNLSSITSVPDISIPTVEIPEAADAFKDVDLSDLGMDLNSISGKIPGVDDLKKFL